VAKKGGRAVIYELRRRKYVTIEEGGEGGRPPSWAIWKKVPMDGGGGFNFAGGKITPEREQAVWEKDVQ